MIHQRWFGFLWCRQPIPPIYFDFPVNWLLSVAVFDTEGDARDALYAYLHHKYPSPDYNVHVKDLSWF